ncbi:MULTISPECIES: helix-turn-helix transcriptional regulator [Streptomyces]|uniref:helix-turn-helix transcriptional regulator n=1 Tax=Streptomyces TaxID=1883 RepID=UPI0004C00BD7|nr:MULTISPECIES: AAA family ATPase [Streptomyces]KOU01716.1 LuxR family transcriptional regulator [Streptomyces sp. NRRL F-2295]MBD3556366.1 AAA family ATPase [Streptomyces sp. SP18CM02]MYW82452.1 AAA family ATPase [Streptomyces sp. SID8369]SDC39253.1 regulatory protein, luxR family [Streptomyces sp. LaPpAH-199]
MRATSPVIVGRDEEIGLLSSALDAVRRRSGRALFLLGDAGIGKSRLVGECAYRAYGLGMPVLRGRATSTGLVVPFRPLAEALASRFRAAGTPTDPELAPYHPALARLVPEWRRDGSPGYPETVVELAEALLRLLSVLGREAGCAILLEDLHDCDTETIAVVEYVIDNLADLPILFLGTLRPEPGAALDLVRSAERRQTAAVREMGPLHDAQVRVLTGACLEARPEEIPEPVHRKLAERASGNPYLLEVLLADLLDTGRLRRTDDGWEAVEQEGGQIPSDIVRSWARRLERLDEPVRDLLLAAATLGSQFSVAVLQTVTGFEDRALFTHLRSAVEAGVIAPDGAAPDRYTFRHSLTAEALISSLAPAERASLARRAAGAIEHSGQPLDEDGRQLVATLQLAAGNRAAAAGQFAEAGRRMLASGAHGSAVVLLERAHPLAAERDRAAVAESLAVARAEGGDLDGALALADALPPVPARSEDASRRGRTHVELAWAAVMAERPADAARQAAVARDLLGPSPLPGPQAALAVVDGHLALLPGHGRADRDPVGAGRAVQRAAETAEAEGLPHVACQGWQLLALLRREEGFDAADAALERMLSISTEHALPVWRVEALVRLGANAFMRTGDASRLLSARAAATDLGALRLTRTVDGLLAMNAVLCARWEEAREIVDRSAESSARVGDLSTHRYLLLAGATMAAHRGRRREMDRALAAFRRAGGEKSLLVPLRSGLCRGFGALLEEDRERASASLDEALAWEADQPSYYYLSGRYGLRPLLRVLAGAADRAELAEARSAPGGCLAWNRQFLELADAVLRGREGDAAGAARLMASFDALSAPFPVARHLGLRLAAEPARADGWGDPVAWLRTAEEFFYGAGVQPVASACRAALRQAGASVGQHRGGWDRIPSPLRTSGVTPREYEVFVLLPERPGNQQIARRLSISPRTVEKHMASLLSKTGRADRAALCEFAAECAAEPA